MKRKRILAGILSAAMVLGMSGCAMPFGAKDPTAQELLSGMESVDRDKYNSMNITLDADIVSDGQKAGMGLDASLEAKGDVAHLYDTTVSISFSGFSMDMGMEGWMDYEDGMGYMNVSAMGQESGWTKSPIVSSQGISDVSGLVEMFVDISDEDGKAVLSEHKKGEDYVVTWTMDADEVSDAISGMMEDFGAESVDWESMDVSASFDEETHTVKSVTVSAKVDQDGIVSDMTMGIAFLVLNGDKDLAIPADVIDNSVEEEEEDEDAGSGIFGDVPDDGTGGSVPEDDGIDSHGSEADKNLIDDGNGHDEVMDRLAGNLAAANGGEGTVYIHHYEDSATINYYIDRDEWYGTMTVDRIFDGAYSTAQDRYEDHYDWMEQSWYRPEEKVSGSKEDGMALFARKNAEDGTCDADFACFMDDMYIEISVHGYDSEPEELQPYIQEMTELLSLE